VQIPRGARDIVAKAQAWTATNESTTA